MSASVEPGTLVVTLPGGAGGKESPAVTAAGDRSGS